MQRWFPVTAFLSVFLLVGTWGAIELRNVLVHPSVDRFVAPSGHETIVLYHKSGRSRAADLLYELPEGKLEFVAPVYYAGKNRDGGDESKFDALHWTRDGSAFYATGQKGQLLWLFETATISIYAGRLAAEKLQAAGGAGELVVRWFELGSTEGAPRLWSWETTRYENALRRSR